MADCLASVACGLQNALATNLSGAVLRTTHMTGVITDLGLMLGHALRGQRVDRWRLWIYIALLSGFSIGGVFTSVLTGLVGNEALLFPSLLALTMGGTYWRWYVKHADLHEKPM